MAKKSKRRGPGEGSIYKQEKKRTLKDGTVKTTVYWYGELYFGKDANGKKLVERFSGKSYKEVQEKMEKAKSDRQKGILTEPSSKETVGQFLERWLQDSAKMSVRPLTFESYDRVVRRHIIPDLGNTQLKKLTPAQVQGLYAKKLEAGLSPRSVEYIHSILHRALKQAVKWGLVSRNVCEAVDRPKVTRLEMKVLNADQVRALLKTVEGDRLEALYVLAVSTGMRVSELAGLCWDAVDLEERKLKVIRQLQWINGEGFVFGEPKTKKGKRTIPLTDAAVRSLKAHRKRQNEERLALGEAWQDKHGLVFTSPIGQPLTRYAIRSQFNNRLKKAGLPKIRFHNLRHTCATLMLQAGVNVKVVSEILGHSTVTLTLDTYSHVLPLMQEDAAVKMDALLGTEKAAPLKGTAAPKK